MKKITKQHCEFLRHQAKSKFDKVRGTWCDLLRWALPYRATWILSQTQGERKNQHIVDPTHILALRSFVAGFLEGNTSATRPWVRIGTRDGQRDDDFEVKKWLQHFTDRVHSYMSSSNFYHAAGNFYYDYGVVNTGAHYIEELEDGFFFHTLIPGAYFVLNNSYGEADVLVREFCLNVKSVVETYGTYDEDGKADWSNISGNVRKMYEEGNYDQQVDIVHVVQRNPNYKPSEVEIPENRQWIELTYEMGLGNAEFSKEGIMNGDGGASIDMDETYLKTHYTQRKPFIVGKSTDDFEYGEKGPTLDSLGLIRSLNKKAIGKDEALEKMLSPALQGPASLRKSYVSQAANTFVPLDSRSISQNQKIEPIYQINPAIGALIQDVSDMRGQVDKLYFADFLLFLSKNPKTRTATEANAIVEEQQRIIGPNLQSLNFSYNVPVVEWVMDYVLHEDPYLMPVPEALQGQSLKPEFISVFAQAQRAADLPSIDRYASMIANVAQIDPRVLDKINTDKLADLYEDRLYLPAGLNNPQSKVDAMREQAQAQAQRQQMMEQTIPAMAKAAKDAQAVQPQAQ